MQASLSSAISAMEKLPAESRFLRLILSKKGYKGQGGLCLDCWPPKCRTSRFFCPEGSGLEATNLLVGTNPSDLYRELRGHVLPGASKAITFHVNDSLIRNAQKYFAEKLVGKSGMSFQDFKAGIGCEHVCRVCERILCEGGGPIFASSERSLESLKHRALLP